MLLASVIGKHGLGLLGPEQVGFLTCSGHTNTIEFWSMCLGNWL